MIVKTIVVGKLATNCYLVCKGNKCLIIDPGASPEIIEKELIGLEVVGLLLTHSHFDHTGALNYFITKYHLEVNKNILEFNYEIIKTPGHTKDSVSFYFPEEKIMFTGDFLFQNSFGRTDLGGNNKEMLISLKLINSYPDNIIIYPGHGNSSTLGQEKLNFATYQQYLN